jgi:hypothetical protein
VEFLFFALNPARGVKCITGGQAKRNRRIKSSPTFPKPCKGEMIIAMIDNLAPAGLRKHKRFKEISRK